MKVMAPAAHAGQRIATVTNTGNPTLIVRPRQAGTGRSSIAAIRTDQNNQRGSKGMGLNKRREPMTAAVVRNRQRLTKSSSRSRFLPGFIGGYIMTGSAQAFE